MENATASQEKLLNQAQDRDADADNDFPDLHRPPAFCSGVRANQMKSSLGGVDRGADNVPGGCWAGTKQTFGKMCNCACCAGWVKEPTERIIYPSYSRLKHHANVFHERGKTVYSRLHAPDNTVVSAKYNSVTFVPLVLFEQFRFFLNFFYLMLTLTQFIPALVLGPIFSYMAPLALVLLFSLSKEGYDDYKRHKADKKINTEKFKKITPVGLEVVNSQDIRCGDIIEIEENQRVPADCILLQAPEGQTYIRTDQLDGETDWKARKAVPNAQKVSDPQKLAAAEWAYRCEAPRLAIYEFIGRITYKDLEPEEQGSSGGEVGYPDAWGQSDGDYQSAMGALADDGRSSHAATSTAVANPHRSLANQTMNPQDAGQSTAPASDDGSEWWHGNGTHGDSSGDDFQRQTLGLENTLWASTIVTHGPVLGLAVYTGDHSRARMNTATSHVKLGRLDNAVNFLAKISFLVVLSMSIVMLVARNSTVATWGKDWWIYLFRYLVLTAAGLPIALRIHLDFAKILFSMMMHADKKLPAMAVRNSGIPEELGCIDYLLSDKTGTLTQNEMLFKRLRTNAGEYCDHQMETIASMCETGVPAFLDANPKDPDYSTKMKQHDVMIAKAILTLAVCHNVTPIYDDEGNWDLQAASPDEVALVRTASDVGVKLVERDDSRMLLKCAWGLELEFEILQSFPFNSDTKRMGQIVRNVKTQRLVFMLKGADNVMQTRISKKGAGWLGEDVENYASIGLRTLVMAMKPLLKAEYEEWEKKYNAAMMSMKDRDAKARRVIDLLEVRLELVALTGVEDLLQENVQETLDNLRNAGVRVWMLTGDKVATAICIAISTALKARSQEFFVIEGHNFDTDEQIMEKLYEYSSGQAHNTVLVVDGTVLSRMVVPGTEKERTFITIAAQAPAVVACRCSPTQKADVVRGVRKYTGKITAAIGDGGNDVSMILAAHVGMGIVGKEGQQASMAADFSITKFFHCHRLMLWHGRNAFWRSSRTCLFVFYRGFLNAIIQCIFVGLFYWVPIQLYQGWLLIGYSSYYTTLPVMTFCLDVELPEKVVYLYPELYKVTKKGRCINMKAFLIWLFISVYQGFVVMCFSVFLFKGSIINIVAITYTAMVLLNLVEIADEIQTWTSLMLIAQSVTFSMYLYSMFILRQQFDVAFVFTIEFIWKTGLVIFVAWFPIFLIKALSHFLRPSEMAKIRSAYKDRLKSEIY